jgi:hypothetical protein
MLFICTPVSATIYTCKYEDGIDSNGNKRWYTLTLLHDESSNKSYHIGKNRQYELLRFPNKNGITFFEERNDGSVMLVTIDSKSKSVYSRHGTFLGKLLRPTQKTGTCTVI